jgi:diguanylate cyclase (GGDEF)-like protein
VVPIVRHHHERWDGSGYPDALRGENIPIGARILSVVDCFDALTSNRQYRPSLPVDEAVLEVVRLSGRSFDPAIVALLKDNYKQWEEEVKNDGTPLTPAVPLADAVAAAGTGRLAAAGAAAPEQAPAFAAGSAASSGMRLSNESLTNQSANGESSKAEFISSISAARKEVLSLLELNQDLSNSLELEEMLRMVAVRVQKLVPHDTFAVYRLSDGHLMPELVAGEDYRKFNSLRIPLGEGLTGWVAQNRKSIVNGNPAVESGYLEARRSANGADKFPMLPPLGGLRGIATGEHRMFTLLRSGLCVPLEVGDTLVGVLSLYSVAKDAFTRDHVRVLATVATQLAPALQNGLHLRHAENESLTDFLTGLPNMRSLQERLQQEVQNYTGRGLPFSILLCDLDGFKQVNDRFGHLEGNRVLQMAATTLRNNCRELDFVARLGGDEFVLILPGGSEMQAQLYIQRLTRAIELEGARMLGADTGHVSASFGAAHVPQDGLNIDQILDIADNRMFRAKTMRKAERIEAASSLAALRSGVSSSTVAESLH